VADGAGADGGGFLGSAVLELTTDNSEYNLGIDDAQTRAIEMDKAFDATHKRIKNNFSEKFEHAGLYIFTRQALGAVGMGDLARHAFGAISAAITGVSEAAGIATSTLGPLLFGIGAAVAVYEMYAGKAEKAAKQQEEFHKAQLESMNSTVELKEKLHTLEEQLGKLPSKWRDLKTAMDEAVRVQTGTLTGSTGELIEKQRKQIETASQLRDEYEKQRKVLVDVINHWKAHGVESENEAEHANALTHKIREQTDIITISQNKIKELTADIKAQAAGYKSATDQVEKEGESEAKRAEKAKQAAKELRHIEDELQAKYRETEQKRAEADEKIAASEEKLGALTKRMANDEAETTRNVQQKKKAAIQQYHDEKMEMIKKEYQEARLATTDAQQIVEITRNRDEAINQLNKTVAAKQKENYSEMKQAAVEVGHTITSDIGGALGDILVDGKNVADAMKDMAKDVAKEVIRELVRIEVQAMVTKAAVSGIFL
jgi:chromosome segregation ATPase